MTTLGRLMLAFAAVAGIGSAAPAQQPRDSTFELAGVVQTSDGRPVPDADVMLLALASTRTDSAGRFIFRGVPRGTVLVRVQRLGLAPIMRAVDVGAEHPREIVMRFGETATTLATVVVRDSAVALRDPGGFESRRRTGHGVYFSEGDLTRRNARSVEHILNAAWPAAQWRSGRSEPSGSSRHSLACAHSCGMTDYCFVPACASSCSTI